MGKASNIFNDSYPYHDDVSIASSALASIESDFSSLVATQRRCPLCPQPVCIGSVHSHSSYMDVKREMETLVKSKDELLRLEMRLEAERSRGRMILAMCLLMILICSVLFMDQLPKDWKTVLVKYLEKQKKFEDTGSRVESNYPKSSDPLPIVSPSISYNGFTVDKSNSNNGESLTHTPLKQTQPELEDVEEKTAQRDESLEDIFEKKFKKLTFFNKWNIPFRSDRETPVHWHIHRTGGFILDGIFSHCFKLTQAVDNVGLLGGHENDENIEVYQNNDGGKYVNVNMGSKEGIERAKKLNLLSWHIPFIVRTPFFFEIADFFHSGRYGKCFTILRHPVDRAMDVFQHLKEIEKPGFVNMTLQEYAKSKFCEENWMVRILSDSMNDNVLSDEHFKMAQKVLRGKCLIGFTDKMEESILRFSKYFEWDQKVSEINLRNCLSGLVRTNSNDNESPFHWHSSLVKHPEYGEGSEVWKTLAKRNSLDLKLYNDAKSLYEMQQMYVTRWL